MGAFKFGVGEVRGSVKVLAWTVVSAGVAFLLDLAGAVEVPVEVLWLMPSINTALYALQQYVQDNAQRLSTDNFTGAQNKRITREVDKNKHNTYMLDIRNEEEAEAQPEATPEAVPAEGGDAPADDN